MEQDQCQSLVAASWLSVSFAEQVLGFLDEGLASHFSSAFTWYKGTTAFTTLESASFRTGKACPAPSSSSTPRISFASMRGFFLTCGLFAGASILCAVGLHMRRVVANRRPVKAVEDGEKATRAEAAAAEVV